MTLEEFKALMKVVGAEVYDCPGSYDYLFIVKGGSEDFTEWDWYRWIDNTAYVYNNDFEKYVPVKEQHR